MTALGRLGPVAVAAVVVALARPAAQFGVSRPGPDAASSAAAGTVSPWLDPGRLRGWLRAGSGWLLRYQPDHGAWLLDLWLPDDGGTLAWRLDAAEWLPGARLGPEAAATWLGSGKTVPREELGRRDWSGDGQSLAGSLPSGGGIPRSSRPSESGPTAVLAGLLLAGAVARRLDRRAREPVWVWLVGAASMALVALAPALSPLGGRLLAAGVRPAVTGLAWWAGVTVLMGGMLFAAVTCPAARGARHARLLPWAFVLGLAAAAVSPVSWIAELASLEASGPAVLALAVLGGWLAGLAGDGLGALLAPLGPARRLALVPVALAAVAWSGPFMGPGLAVVAAAAAGRRGGAWLGLAVTAGVLVGSLGSVCLWPSAQWAAWAALVVGFAVTGTAGLLAAETSARRVQSGG